MSRTPRLGTIGLSIRGEIDRENGAHSRNPKLKGNIAPIILDIDQIRSRSGYLTDFSREILEKHHSINAPMTGRQMTETRTASKT